MINFNEFENINPNKVYCCIATEENYKAIIDTLKVSNTLAFGSISTKEFFEKNEKYIVINYSSAYLGGSGSFSLGVTDSDRLKYLGVSVSTIKEDGIYTIGKNESIIGAIDMRQLLNKEPKLSDTMISEKVKEIASRSEKNNSLKLG